jgi:hypothetical protein
MILRKDQAMRSLIVTLALITCLSAGSLSHAEDKLLALESDIENFTSGELFYQVLTDLDAAGGSTPLFTEAREKIEPLLQRHKNIFLGLPLEEQAALIKKITVLSKTAKPTTVVFPKDRTRTDVHGMLLQWGRGRLEGLMDGYVKLHLKEIEEEEKIIKSRRLQIKLEDDKEARQNSGGLLVDPSWNR